MATTNRLLKSAICALAAKHLSWIEKSPINKASLSFLSKSLARVARTSVQATWPYQAAQFYDRAVSLLKEMLDVYHFDNNAADYADITTILATAAILSMFELMDGPGDGWRAHLDVLRLLDPACTPSGISNPPMTFPTTFIRGPIFWNLVRQDFLCACMS